MTRLLNPQGLSIAEWKATQPMKAAKIAKDTPETISAPFLPLFTLPREVLYTLSEHCAPNDLFNLSLTCKYALYAIGAYTLPLARQSPEYASHEWEFLKTLQKDHPDLEKCYACKKLHARFACDGPRQGDKSLTCYKGGPQALDFGYVLRFGHVQSVMDRHFLGEKFGVPMSTLAVSTPWRRVGYLFGKPDTRAPEDTVRDYIDVSTPYFRKVDITSKIVDDELVLATTQRYWIHGSEVKTLITDQGRKPFRMEVCSHQCGHRRCDGGDDEDDMNALQKSMFDVLEVAALIDGSSPAPRSLHVWQGDVKHCKECPTEFLISAMYEYPRKIEIAVQSWQILGNGRDITERGWKECYGKREDFKIPEQVGEVVEGPHNRPLRPSPWYFLEKENLRDLFGSDEPYTEERHESEADVLKIWKEVDARSS
ncbi:hypothetical protein EJ08DRAFT_451102 [Tothia fuscella]|uniref:F-box domain-containing protein n=1 Tax=Tothia fuscella TaxID=1048955 RepID=A0A9P4TTU2_9PEZI|nr:hypothetical protein EJ08DRAFT_451102 [Tothia fuscella]